MVLIIQYFFLPCPFPWLCCPSPWRAPWRCPSRWSAWRAASFPGRVRCRARCTSWSLTHILLFTFCRQLCSRMLSDSLVVCAWLYTCHGWGRDAILEFWNQWIAWSQRRCCRSPGSRGASRRPSGSCHGPCGRYNPVSVLNYKGLFPSGLGSTFCYRDCCW